MRPLSIAIPLLVAACPALAEFVEVPAEGSVPEVTERLVAAAQAAGATIFATVDHAEGAASVGMALEPATLVIFGNPRIGTPIIAADVTAGLMLPLRVLVTERGGGTVLIYEVPADMVEGLDVPTDGEEIAAVVGALDKLTAAAASP